MLRFEPTRTEEAAAVNNAGKKTRKPKKEKRESYSFRPEIIKLLNEGMTIDGVVEKLGVTRKYVRQFVVDLPKKKTEVEAMIAAGKSNGEIAKIANCSPQYVWALRKRVGKVSKRDQAIALLKKYAEQGVHPAVRLIAEEIECSEPTVRSAMCAVYGASGREAKAEFVPEATTSSCFTEEVRRFVYERDGYTFPLDRKQDYVKEVFFSTGMSTLVGFVSKTSDTQFTVIVYFFKRVEGNLWKRVSSAARCGYFSTVEAAEREMHEDIVAWIKSWIFPFTPFVSQTKQSNVVV